MFSILCLKQMGILSNFPDNKESIHVDGFHIHFKRTLS